MKNYIKCASAAFLFSSMSNYVFALDNAAQQVQALNSKIQVQLQQIQQAQQKQLVDMNKQLQDQIQSVQATLEKEIQTVNSRLQQMQKPQGGGKPAVAAPLSTLQ